MKPTSAFSFVKSKGKVLVIKDRLGRWTLPGGQIDKGESAKKAAKRETFEETGLKILLKKKKKKTKKYKKNKKKGIVYRAITKGRNIVALSFEHVKFKWVSLEKAVDMLIIRHAMTLVCLV